VEPPTFDRQLARVLASRVASLYADAYACERVADDFVSSCVEEWARNPSRDPRRLIRLLIHRLDCRRALAGGMIEATGLPATHRGGAMRPEDAESEFDRLVRAVSDLSGREPSKFRDLKNWIAEVLHIPADKVSVKYLGTPNNLKNRLTESGGQGPDLTIALTAPEDVPNVARTARQLVGDGKPLKAVVVATEGKEQRWSMVWCIDASTTRAASRLSGFFPSMKVE